MGDEDYSQKFISIYDEFEAIKRDCASVFQKAADARRAYEIAEATSLSALKNTEGTVQEKKAKAELACVEVRKQRDDAEIREKVLKLTFSALESQLGAIQSAARFKRLEDEFLGHTT
jgi:predicted  nucleic acid-binding Zn-ribbon protein